MITRRLRGVFELAVVITAAGVLVGLAAAGHGVQVERARVADALHRAIHIKQEMAGAYAAYGRWPAPQALPRDIPGGAVRAEYADGAFTLFVEGTRATYGVSFRAALPEASPRAPMLWVCGYAAVPPGFRTVAGNRTDVPAEYLPAACRGPI